LTIEPIPENEYLNAKGRNVIQDAISNSYYSVELEKHMEDVVENVTFINFKDAYDGAKDTPISYVDDNGYWLTPFTAENNKVLSYLDCCYSIQFVDSNSEVFTYLHAMED
jgi:hypothetical protein